MPTETAKNPLGRPLLRFLKELAENNDRDWFLANKQRYEAHVRGPAQAFISNFARSLERISKHYDADPRPVGGSLFRINRDTRFSKDKSPYKTFTGIQFRHELARDVHTPGFYLHLQPRECFIGVGLWHPDTKSARAVREAIVADPRTWKRIAHGKAIARVFSLEGESLKRPPRDFDPDHPLVEDLKRKDFVAVARLKDREVVAPDFPVQFAAACRSGAPFVRFLCGALELEF